jgi:hypothetical protein
MASTRRRRLRAEHERQVLARESSRRRRDAVAHSAPAGRDLDGVAKVLAAIALLVVLLMIAVALAA